MFCFCNQDIDTIPCPALTRRASQPSLSPSSPRVHTLLPTHPYYTRQAGIPTQPILTRRAQPIPMGCQPILTWRAQPIPMVCQPILTSRVFPRISVVLNILTHPDQEGIPPIPAVWVGGVGWGGGDELGREMISVAAAPTPTSPGRYPSSHPILTKGLILTCHRPPLPHPIHISDFSKS